MDARIGSQAIEVLGIVHVGELVNVVIVVDVDLGPAAVGDRHAQAIAHVIVAVGVLEPARVRDVVDVQQSAGCVVRVVDLRPVGIA